MLKEDQLNQLKKALDPYLPVLGKATDAILDQEVSDYPIFILTNEIANIGIPLVDELKTMEDWSINASSLEEFSTKQVIQSGRVEDFRSIYKDAKDNFCLFIMEKGEAQFVFIPRSN